MGKPGTKIQRSYSLLALNLLYATVAELSDFAERRMQKCNFKNFSLNA